MHHIGSSALQLLYIYFIHYWKVNINFLFRIVSLTILPIISTCFINKLCAKLIIHWSHVIQDNILWKKFLELLHVSTVNNITSISSILLCFLTLIQECIECILDIFNCVWNTHVLDQLVGVYALYMIPIKSSCH